jgi:Calx-beta domain
MTMNKLRCLVGSIGAGMLVIGVAPPASADPGTDFQAARGTVTFEPGSTETTVTITVFGDDLAEGHEWIVVTFSNLSTRCWVG